MVQAQENWAELEGTVTDIRPDPERPGRVIMLLSLEGSNSVEGYPNFFEENIGQALEVAVDVEDVDVVGLSVGAKIRCRATKAGPWISIAQRDHMIVLERPSDG